MTSTQPLEGFHPAVRAWFERRFGAPTDAQAEGWPRIRAREDVLVSAPTGSGKTMAAFLAGIDELLGRAEGGALEDETAIVYVSPLKALGNDIQRNLEGPLAEIVEVASGLGLTLPELRTGVRTGDTPSSERAAMVRKPPHILITTPESLYLLLTSARGRETLRHVRTVIVDEIHALARDRRGSHLALSLERLDHVVTDVERGGLGVRPQRIGLSATVRPIEEIARFLGGAGLDGARTLPAIVDLGHQRDLELAVEVPPTELEAVMTAEQWSEVYDRLAELIAGHHTTLIFVNTRRTAERVQHHLETRLGAEAVASHHGSLSRERRLRVEQRLKGGELRALVATASLELGIDIGSVDLVCQVGSPGSISAFLQRVGRSGHALGLRPSGRLFPTTRDELVECAALVRAVRAGRLDRVAQPRAPLDVLAQQIVAEAACEDWDERALLALVRGASQYADLEERAYDEVLAVLGEGVGEGAGGTRPLLHRDRIGGVLRARRGSRLTALLNGGTIPEMGDYRVVAEPDETFVGTVNEDFAMESMTGDVFLLGSTSWRIRHIENGNSVVRVADAGGAAPNIPFWLGEAPGRTVELSEEVGALRREVGSRLEAGADAEAVASEIAPGCGLDGWGAAQLVDYLRATRDALGLIPSDTDVIFERFFDETGGMQLVVHAPFGARINRAWGLALRKRFCVTFDFELQAAASDDSILLSLGPQHSFPLEDSFEYVTPSNAAAAVEQSVLYVPLFGTRFRWVTTRALAVPRQRSGRKVPPFLQRRIADDLLAAVFPAQVGCQENVTGPLEVPDHPYVRQAMLDCLHEAMNIEGLLDVLERIEDGRIRLHPRDTTEPSPMAHEIVSGRPFTYLDNAPIEERRTRAVQLRRALPADARDLGELDEAAIALVREQAWPVPRDAEEVHDALLGLVAAREQDLAGWGAHLEALRAAGRAGRLRVGHTLMWFAAESLPAVDLLYPPGSFLERPALPPGVGVRVADREEARRLLLRGHTEALGPVTARELGERTAIEERDATWGLQQLEAGGFVLRGRFSKAASLEEWCDRRLLARVHRLTLDRLRREIDPVSAQDFMRFLLRWQHLGNGRALAGRAGVRAVIEQLQGIEAPATEWESALLPARVSDYSPQFLDDLSLGGELAWGRLAPRRATSEGAGGVPARESGGAGGAPAREAGGAGGAPAREAGGAGGAPAREAGGAGGAPAREAGGAGGAPARESGGAGGAPATRATPVSVVPRANLGGLLALTRGDAEVRVPARGAGAEAYELLRDRGALFFEEIVAATRRLPGDVERGLRELVAAGLVAADGFQGLRQVAGSPNGRGRRRIARRGHRPGLLGGTSAGPSPAGRWALLGGANATADIEEQAEAVAELLLRRYGVVLRELAVREPFAVPWREVLRALRRMEARGTARGGRFIAGFVGEQYALPDAVDSLRRVRREPRDGERIEVSACDPLNLTGVLFPGARVPATTGRTVVYLDGAPLVAVPEATAAGA